MEEQSKIQSAKDLIEQYTDSTTKMNREIERVNSLRPILIDLLGSEAEANKVLNAAIKDIKSEYSGLDDLVKKLDWAFQSAFENAIIEGENLRSVLAGLLEDIARIILRIKVVEPLVGIILEKLPFSKGGVIENGEVKPFARGGIVNKPTIFPMATGLGLMGEAGPEAEMPLARTPSGDLGVKASAGGVIVRIISMKPVEKTDILRSKSVKIMIREACESINDGPRQSNGHIGR